MKSAKSGIQGEGDYEATRRYRKRTESFLAKQNVGKIARQAAPRSKAEAQELLAAENTGRARAKTKSSKSKAASKSTRR